MKIYIIEVKNLMNILGRLEAIFWEFFFLGNYKHLTENYFKGRFSWKWNRVDRKGDRIKNSM